MICVDDEPAEELIVQANIQRLKDTKVRLLREIEETDKLLDIENARYARLRNNKNPALRLPHEVMSTIFTMVHNDHRYSNSQKAQQKALKFLVSTSQVCVSWREIICHTPLLWNEIVMSFRHGFTGESTLTCLNAHLTRSGDCYLDMAFNLGGSYIGYPAFLELIGSHSKRWRRVSFLVSYANVIDFSSVLERLEAPNLEHFSINIQQTHCGGPNSPRMPYQFDPSLIFPHGTPKLTFLRLGGAALGTMRPNWTSMETLHLDGWERTFMTREQFKCLVQTLPNLTNLSLHKLCIRYPRDPFEKQSDILLPQLRSLRIREPYTSMDMVVPTMVMPKLETLHLQRVEAIGTKLNPSVKHLNLETCGFEDHQVMKLITNFPSLESLGIDDCPLGSFCNQLCPPDGQTTIDPVPWPQLTSLTIRQLSGSNVHFFVWLLVARKDCKVPVGKVRIDRRSRGALRSKHRLDWLSNEMEMVVENCDYLDRWPPGLGYDDPHDLED
ncbi:hypothetical protein CC2G_007234 [Coprinopsis cinerea AmutBmut pab1-1]|nr:hypothetical protein CC2G_007234 [Coprinopsis cinerea AmutBmut pab1-1]